MRRTLKLDSEDMTNFNFGSLKVHKFIIIMRI